MRKLFLLWKGSNTGADCPGKLQSLHPWRYENPNWTQYQLTMVWAGGWIGWSPECLPTPAVLWLQDLLVCEMLTSPDPLGCCIYCAAQPAAHRFAFSSKVCLTQWGSWEKPGMTFKEAKLWLFSLAREEQAPRKQVLCVRHWLPFPALCPRQFGQSFEDAPGRAELTPPAQAEPSPAPQPSPQQGSCDGAAEAAGGGCCLWSLQETPSRSAICWVPAMQPWELLELPSHRCREAMESSSSQQASSSLPRLAGHASAEGDDGARAKEVLPGFTQPDSHWNEK